MDADLCNQLMTAFKDTYFYPLKHSFTEYSVIPTLQLIGHLCNHYARISDTDLTANYTKLLDLYNPNEPLKSLYMSLNKCIDYSTSQGKPVTIGQLFWISYGLVSDTGQLQ